MAPFETRFSASETSREWEFKRIKRLKRSPLARDRALIKESQEPESHFAGVPHRVLRGVPHLVMFIRMAPIPGGGFRVNCSTNLEHCTRAPASFQRHNSLHRSPFETRIAALESSHCQLSSAAIRVSNGDLWRELVYGIDSGIDWTL